MKPTSYIMLGVLLLAVVIAFDNANQPDTNLNANVVPTGVILTSSTGNDTFILCGDESYAGLLCPPVMEQIGILWAEYEGEQDGTEGGQGQQDGGNEIGSGVRSVCFNACARSCYRIVLVSTHL